MYDASSGRFFRAHVGWVSTGTTRYYIDERGLAYLPYEVRALPRVDSR